MLHGILPVLEILILILYDVEFNFTSDGEKMSLTSLMTNVLKDETISQCCK